MIESSFVNSKQLTTFTDPGFSKASEETFNGIVVTYKRPLPLMVVSINALTAVMHA